MQANKQKEAKSIWNSNPKNQSTAKQKWLDMDTTEIPIFVDYKYCYFNGSQFLTFKTFGSFFYYFQMVLLTRFTTATYLLLGFSGLALAFCLQQSIYALILCVPCTTNQPTSNQCRVSVTNKDKPVLQTPHLIRWVWVVCGLSMITYHLPLPPG